MGLIDGEADWATNDPALDGLGATLPPGRDESFGPGEAGWACGVAVAAIGLGRDESSQR